MKRKKLLSAFDGVEDKYLAEADPSVKRKTVIHVLSAVTFL